MTRIYDASQVISEHTREMLIQVEGRLLKDPSDHVLHELVLDLRLKIDAALEAEKGGFR